MIDFIPLPEPYLTWYKNQVWRYVSVVRVMRREPRWRVFAKVPSDDRWRFNFSEISPGWTRLREMAL